MPKQEELAKMLRRKKGFEMNLIRENIWCVLSAVLVLGFADLSRADLMFSTLAQAENGAVGFNDLNNYFASDFLTDGAPSTISNITAVMGNTGFITHTVTFSIFTDDAGKPGTLVSAFNTPASIPADTPSGFFTSTSPGINLLANTAYWVVGQVNESLILGTVYWRFNIDEGTDGGPFATVPTTEFLLSPNGGGIYLPGDSGNLMFSLEGVSVVPEPGSLAFLAVGGIVVAGCSWRRRRSGHAVIAQEKNFGRSQFESNKPMAYGGNASRQLASKLMATFGRIRATRWGRRGPWIHRPIRGPKYVHDAKDEVGEAQTSI